MPPTPPKENASPQSIVHLAADHAETIVALHMANEGKVSRHQRFVEKLTRNIGRPCFLYGIVIASAVWICLGFFGQRMGLTRWDRAPFPVLEGVWTIGGLLMTTMVLITQNRQAKIDQRQVQLDLQLSLIVDQRTAKIVDLLEQLRRDLPNVRDRVDQEAEILKTTVAAEELALDLEERLDRSASEVEERVEEEIESIRTEGPSSK